jgi:hypothetical protein
MCDAEGRHGWVVWARQRAGVAATPEDASGGAYQEPECRARCAENRAGRPAVAGGGAAEPARGSPGAPARAVQWYGARVAAGALAAFAVCAVVWTEAGAGVYGAPAGVSPGQVVAAGTPPSRPAADPCVRPHLAPALQATIAAPPGQPPPADGSPSRGYDDGIPAVPVSAAFRTFQECRQGQERQRAHELRAGRGAPSASPEGDSFPWRDEP